MTSTTRDRQRVAALRRLLVKPMRSAAIVAHFGGDARYRMAVHNMVARGEVVNLTQNSKKAGLFVLVEHAPIQADERQPAERRKPGRPRGARNKASQPLALDFATGKHLHQVWTGAQP